MRVVLVDGGGSNLGSVRCALQRLGVEAEMAGTADDIRAADRVILPGVGAAAAGMARLREQGFVETLRTLDRPLLGVCVGMQLLFERSEEGDVECLGLLPGTVALLPPAPGLRVPHMGWNTLHRVGKAAPPAPEAAGRDDAQAGDAVPTLIQGIEDGAHAYFVHSYAAPVGPDCLIYSEHGTRFAAVVQRGNVGGAQFHPERSADVGARLLRNFLEHGLA